MNIHQFFAVREALLFAIYYRCCILASSIEAIAQWQQYNVTTGCMLLVAETSDIDRQEWRESRDRADHRICRLTKKFLVKFKAGADDRAASSLVFTNLITEAWFE